MGFAGQLRGIMHSNGNFTMTGVGLTEFSTEPINNSISRALDYEQFRDSAFDNEAIDAYSHEKAAWDYGNYVGNPYVAGAARTFSEFLYQFPVYTAEDVYSRVVDGTPGTYQPYTLDGPGGILDSFSDIQNTIDGANNIPMSLGNGLTYPSISLESGLSNSFANGGFVLYPSKPNTNFMISVYQK